MFDAAKAEQICEQIADGKSLTVACANAGVGRTQVYQWLGSVVPFANNYARARETQADSDADDIAAVRERMLAGELTPEQARVAIDSLKWSAGKRKPKVYGDRIQADVDLNVTVTIDDPRITALQAKLAARALPKPEPNAD